MRLVIFDTNVWLDLYMIHPIALKDIVTHITENKGEFWIPEQVYWEFTRNSKQKRETAFNVISKVSTDLRKLNSDTSDQIKKKLIYLKNNNIMEDDTFIFDIENSYKEIKYKIKHGLDTINNQYQRALSSISEVNDIVYELVENIYKENPSYITTSVERIKLYEEGELRIKYHIPPGLSDTDKEDANEDIAIRRRYGDFLIWKDLIRKTCEIIETESSLVKDEIIQVIFVEN